MTDFRDAWFLTLASILFWIASGLILEAPSFNALMRAGWFALSAFGFTTSTVLLIASRFAWRAGFKNTD
jgi:hypothetical protein